MSANTCPGPTEGNWFDVADDQQRRIVGDRFHEPMDRPRPMMCRFLDAGMTRGASHSGGRRPKSAKARSRGKLGSGWAASAMGI